MRVFFFLAAGQLLWRNEKALSNQTLPKVCIDSSMKVYIEETGVLHRYSIDLMRMLMYQDESRDLT